MEFGQPKGNANLLSAGAMDGEEQQSPWINRLEQYSVSLEATEAILSKVIVAVGQERVQLHHWNTKFQRFQ